jgi:UDP-3-O-acyl-N-acetylglucosamine deacetylase
VGDTPYGRILAGSEAQVREARARWAEQPVDFEMLEDGDTGYAPERTTVGDSFSVGGPGTFLGKVRRTLRFEPTRRAGWWFDRSDLPTALPIHVSVNNVWTTVRNLVLCSGSPRNYMRMVEHIVALKVGMRLDSVMIRMESGDPPLFDRGSLDMLEAVQQAGIETCREPAPTVTVAEPVTMGGPNGSFLTFLPAEAGSRDMFIDCAIDFRSAIGKQRIRIKVTPRSFLHGAQARTNTSLGTMLYTKTIGLLFADTRNLGYTRHNILIAGPKRYLNKPGLVHEGKSLEAVWHRAALDLLAAVALIDRGRFAGRIVSYKAGHTLDVQMIRQLYRQDLLRVV